MKNNKGNTNSDKHKLLSKFLKVFLTAFTTIVLIVALGTGIYIFLFKGTGKEFANAGTTSGSNPTANGKEEIKLKRVTTFAVYGVDKEGYRTDVAMLVFFNSETNKIDVISIPRDTMVTIPDDIYEEITQTRSGVSQTIKINEVPAYVEKSKRSEVSVLVLEETLGIDIDYYMTLNLDGFKTIVDLVGPIEVEIPFDMVYSDPVQDLYINLKAGVQEINGAQAEELIRYRKGYADGDLGRIDMQHEFMKAFLNELLTVENKVNIVNIGSTALNYLETDFTSAIDYVNYIDDISPENLSIQTIPGEAKNLGRSYYIFDPVATNDLLKAILEGNGIDMSEAATEQVNPADLVEVKDLKISVQNGTDISGFAGKTKSELEDEGYTVAEAVDYEEKPVVTTKLIVPSEKIGQTLAAYFNAPEIEINPDIFDQEIQVIIILGESDGEIDE